MADAELAVQNGADLIGMIMWPKAKRSVDDSTAAAISACTSQDHVLYTALEHHNVCALLVPAHDPTGSNDQLDAPIWRV